MASAYAIFHSIILAWKIPWVEATDGLQSMGPQRAGHNWVTEQEVYILEFPVLYRRSLLLICFTYSSVYKLISTF